MGEEKKQKKRSGKKWIAFGLVILLGALFGILYVDQVSGEGKILEMILPNLEKPKQEKEESISQGEADIVTEPETPMGQYISLDADGKASFLPIGSGFYMCSKDGVRLYTDMKTQKWSETFTMGNPVMAQEGKYLAVGDLSGNVVRVYGEKGFLYEARVEGSLGFFALNESGFLGVINHGESAYGVTVYNNTGKKIKGRVEESKGIYPLSVDISEDNRVFAVSYLDTTDIEVIGRVLYFYIDIKEGEKFADSMFAAVEKEGEILSRLSFLRNNILVVVSDKNVYGISGSGIEKWKVALTNRVDQMVFAGKKYLILAYGESISTEEPMEVGTVVWIDGNGKVESSFSTKEKINYLSGSEEGAVVGVGRKYYGLKQGGKKIWEHTSRQDTKDILMMENETKVLYVTRSTAQIFQTTSSQWEEKSKGSIMEKVMTKYEVVTSENKKQDVKDLNKEDVDEETQKMDSDSTEEKKQSAE